MKKENIVPVITLFLICVTVTALLAFVYGITKDAIAKQSSDAINKTCRAVMPEGDTFTEKESDDPDILLLYEAYDKGNTLVGYVVATAADGYGGPVKVMTGLRLDGSIAGISIIESNETPGLGKKAESKSFTDKYKSDEKVDGFSVIKGNSDGDVASIEAITGATTTTKAVTEAVNKAIKAIGGQS